ncbi:MAG: hypothetical protein LBN36_07480 [Clostridiales Family XIII bacterium]|jgi:hypothetical protein|nr:hypothetical protein [Clostridiales Family XIII bacterium]
MGLFGKKKNQEPVQQSQPPQPVQQNPPVQQDFSDIDSNEKAEELVSSNILKQLYIVPVRFGGSEDATNWLYAPLAAIEAKDRYDDKVEQWGLQGQINGYRGIPEYKGTSIIPSKLTILVSLDKKIVSMETIDIW